MRGRGQESTFLVSRLNTISHHVVRGRTGRGGVDRSPRCPCPDVNFSFRRARTRRPRGRGQESTFLVSRWNNNYHVARGRAGRGGVDRSPRFPCPDVNFSFRRARTRRPRGRGQESTFLVSRRNNNYHVARGRAGRGGVERSPRFLCPDVTVPLDSRHTSRETQC